MNDLQRVQELYEVEPVISGWTGKNIKATVSHKSRVSICDYVYKGRCIYEDARTYVILSGWTKVTLHKEFTTVERWNDADS
jgi:hypothetical protein